MANTQLDSPDAAAAAAFAAAPPLTSTTAPGKVFASRNDLADHYKSDWHKYNLKRREAGLPLLLEADFQARLAAALSLRQVDHRNGTNHLKKGKKQKPKKQQPQQDSNTAVVLKSQAAAYDKIKNETQEDKEEEEDDDDDPTMMETTATETTEEQPKEKEEEEEEHVVIDPKQCLFDRHFSATVEANADRMYRKYGFFLPDREYLVDVEGLIGFCHEKIKLGHMCLYCHKVFPTWQGCQKHMISKSHTKMKYEAGVDLEDLSVFYDFTEADNEFLEAMGAASPTKQQPRNSSATDDGEEVMEDDGDQDWEDISDDDKDEKDQVMEEAGGEQDDDDDDELYNEYEEQLARFGFDVNDLGELVLPNGKVIGHRALSRYYKQRVPTRNNDNNTAIVAARRAAGERLFNGQVYNIHGSDENALALTKAGINPNIAAGRAANGILVNGAGGVYTSLSIYRYRAAVRKQRREDRQGKRLYEKSKQNINRMDKKHNRLMNNVSVAHASR